MPSWAPSWTLSGCARASTRSHSPTFSIDVPEEVIEGGKRLCLINVPPALSEIRSGGKLRARLGTDCVELHGDRARQFLEHRRTYDWSTEGSSERLSTCDPDALRSAHRHYRERHGVRALSDIELLRRLGVAVKDGEDPQLNQSGVVLLCPYEPAVERRINEEGRALAFPGQHGSRDPVALNYRVQI